jgi:hypothetical protein
MPLWTPKPVWKKQDVYIIGGGPSLQGFEWGLLRGKHTIGCNSAFTLGADVCNICVFGDAKWFLKYKPELKRYKGLVVTNCTNLKSDPTPWLLYMERKPSGLHTDCLGWNGNTGASAINLALILGAKRVILLGFDMKLGKGNKPNWHDRVIDRPSAEVYTRFLGGFQDVVRDWGSKFSDRDIVNATPGTALQAFPVVELTSCLG